MWNGWREIPSHDEARSDVLHFLHLSLYAIDLLYLSVFFFSRSIFWILIFFPSTVSEHSPSGRNTVYMSVCMCESGEGSAARKRLTLCPSCCSVSARGHAVVCWELKRPWVTASFLLWSPWKQESVFPSKLSGALHHIKRRCHESDSSSTGSLTIAELTAYKAVCRSFNGLWFPIWPSWLRYFKSVKWLVLVFCLNS